MNTMDHQQAVRMHAAERYLLEELSPEEREEFEAHYFACGECADEVQAAFVFADNATAVMTDEPFPAVLAHSQVDRAARNPLPRPASSWWGWLQPAFAPALAALLLAVTLYQSIFVIPGLQHKLDTVTAPRAIPSTVARAASRGEEVPVELSAADQFVQVILDIDSTVPVSSYVCEIYDESATLRFAVPAPAAANGGSLNLLLPAPGLKPGRYTVKVRSGDSGSQSETANNFSFVVRHK